MSRIRTNLITNRMANGAPTVSNGLVISGVTTVTTLDVNGTSDFSGDAVFNSDVDIVDAIVHVGDTDTKIRFPAADTISFETTGSEKLRLTSTGQLLVNTTSASISSNELFEVKSTGGGFSHFRNNSSTYAPIYIDNEASNGGATLVPLITFTDGGGNRAGFLLNNSSQFDISAAGSLSLSTGSNVGSATERLRITGGGNVGINSTNPGSPLEIYTAASAAWKFRIDTTVSDGAGFYQRANGDFEMVLRDASNNNNYIAGTSGALQFATSGSERLRITSGGQALFSGLTSNNDPRNVTGISVKSTGGVSFQNYGGNGSRNWRIRPDDMSRWGDLDFSVSPTSNSATDWPDAASDIVMSLGYDGTVKKPRQPVFVAQKSAVISGTGYVTCNTVITNVGSHYNGSTGKFTAPVTGKYWFSMKINTYKRIDFEIRRNATTGNGNREIGQFNTSNQDGWYSHIVQRVFELNANDYIQPYVSNLTQNTDPGEWITFQGYLIC